MYVCPFRWNTHLSQVSWCSYVFWATEPVKISHIIAVSQWHGMIRKQMTTRILSRSWVIMVSSSTQAVLINLDLPLLKTTATWVLLGLSYLVGWLAGWFDVMSIIWLAGCSFVGCLTGWLVGWLAGLLVGWLTSWFVVRFIVGLVGWLMGWLVVRLVS